jgi:hypothetical protein
VPARHKADSTLRYLRRTSAAAGWEDGGCGERTPRPLAMERGGATYEGAIDARLMPAAALPRIPQATEDGALQAHGTLRSISTASSRC